MNKTLPQHPGPLALFGSGETAPGGQKIFDFLFKIAEPSPTVAILETPAGFELNSSRVASSVGKFIEHRLQNYHPAVQIIPARKKGTSHSPNNPEIVEPIMNADVIFMGPGSPSYAVRQLRDTLAWEYLLARHRLGAALAFSSATTVAISAFSLPVYEIYKVGEELHWIPGLDFFGDYDLPLIFIPHWNNQDGGAELDTSRCYMGKPRFEKLVSLLPEGQIVIGIDENTGMVFEFQDGLLYAVGQGRVTILKNKAEIVIPAGSSLEISRLGDFQLSNPRAGISSSSWEAALKAERISSARQQPDQEIIRLAEQREEARAASDWEQADLLRDQIEGAGWSIQDAPDGYQLEKIPPQH